MGEHILAPKKQDPWFVYIVQCADETLYTGIAKDVGKRIHAHNHDNRATAKYTRARRPVTLLHQEQCQGRSQASIRECQIKRLTRLQKQQLIKSAKSSSTSDYKNETTEDGRSA